ncbi:MAG: hypothetical protein COB23_02735 [Methylophaga sp.]|nr:MAG: hypothetical protein COB23_02735 [Methylophaga sp.]
MTKITSLGLTVLSAALFLTACSDSEPETLAQPTIAPIESQQQIVVPSSVSVEKNIVEPQVVATKVDLQQLMYEAGRARIQADRLGFEWSVTKPLQDKGLAAYKAGDHDVARALYQEVKNQSLLAIKQSHYADAHWQMLIPTIDD